MMKIVKKSLSSVAQVWCDIQNYLASKNQLDEHNLDFKCQRLEPRQLLSATTGVSEVPVENNINQTQIEDAIQRYNFVVDKMNDAGFSPTVSKATYRLRWQVKHIHLDELEESNHKRSMSSFHLLE